MAKDVAKTEERANSKDQDANLDNHTQAQQTIENPNGQEVQEQNKKKNINSNTIFELSVKEGLAVLAAFGSALALFFALGEKYSDLMTHVDKANTDILAVIKIDSSLSTSEKFNNLEKKLNKLEKTVDSLKTRR